MPSHWWCCWYQWTLNFCMFVDFVNILICSTMICHVRSECDFSWSQNSCYPSVSGRAGVAALIGYSGLPFPGSCVDMEPDQRVCRGVTLGWLPTGTGAKTLGRQGGTMSRSTVTMAHCTAVRCKRARNWLIKGVIPLPMGGLAKGCSGRIQSLTAAPYGQK